MRKQAEQAAKAAERERKRLAKAAEQGSPRPAKPSVAAAAVRKRAAKAALVRAKQAQRKSAQQRASNAQAVQAQTLSSPAAHSAFAKRMRQPTANTVGNGLSRALNFGTLWRPNDADLGTSARVFGDNSSPVRDSEVGDNLVARLQAPQRPRLSCSGASA